MITDCVYVSITVKVLVKKLVIKNFSTGVTIVCVSAHSKFNLVIAAHDKQFGIFLIT